MNIVLVTGGFDPLHTGHIAYFNAAKQLGDKLIVGINSDDWLARKKGQPFMPYEERAGIIWALQDVDGIIKFDDSDDSSRDAIVKLRENNFVLLKRGLMFLIGNLIPIVQPFRYLALLNEICHHLSKFLPFLKEYN